MARNIKLGRLGSCTGADIISTTEADCLDATLNGGEGVWDDTGMFAEKDWTKDPDIGISLETATGGKSFFSTCSPRVVLYKVIGNSTLDDEYLLQDIESVGGTGYYSPNYENGILNGGAYSEMKYPFYFFPFGWAYDPAKVGTTYVVDLNNSSHGFLSQFILFSETKF